jgi:DNA repair protein RecO (recombination protein O)
MRPIYVTQAIVLRARPFGESDKIVSLLTESHGKVTGVAKGAKRSRKRFVNSLEPFSLVNLRFQDRPYSSLAFVVGSDLLLGFTHLLTSLEKVACASYLVEITDGVVGEREENHHVFEHLRDALAYLEKQEPSVLFVTRFELELLNLAGYRPALDRCRRCGNGRAGRAAGSWHFGFRDGGILCETCSKLRREIMPLSIAALEVLSELQQSTPISEHNPSLAASVIREIRALMPRFIQFQTERELKSAPFLHDFSLGQ